MKMMIGSRWWGSAADARQGCEGGSGGSQWGCGGEWFFCKYG
ncbi:hypothetical protein SLEP1_g4264 [Rubroshorea leprosula]|uniref:Uncharacterized protein n=1 Tax=Rubroshorea leprosula TaxID=152421 RepID=A0AAV5HXL7_9ROSI|nr:hypothetical protein SLEP1_g4264 [Rubroshorea leprosula]